MKSKGKLVGYFLMILASVAVVFLAAANDADIIQVASLVSAVIGVVLVLRLLLPKKRQNLTLSWQKLAQTNWQLSRLLKKQLVWV